MKTKLLAFTLLLYAVSTFATTISFTANNISGSTWQYTYSVSNDTLAFDIEEFTIFFDYALYANLQAQIDTPPGWDSIEVQPDLGFPDDGFFDSLALADGIAPGATISGFSILFDYLGTGATPGAQPWHVVDPGTFALLDEGLTVDANIPLPAAAWLLLSGLFGALATRVARVRPHNRASGTMD